MTRCLPWLPTALTLLCRELERAARPSPGWQTAQRPGCPKARHASVCERTGQWAPGPHPAWTTAASPREGPQTTEPPASSGVRHSEGGREGRGQHHGQCSDLSDAGTPSLCPRAPGHTHTHTHTAATVCTAACLARPTQGGSHAADFTRTARTHWHGPPRAGCCGPSLSRHGRALCSQQGSEAVPLPAVATGRAGSLPEVSERLCASGSTGRLWLDSCSRPELTRLPQGPVFLSTVSETNPAGRAQGAWEVVFFPLIDQGSRRSRLKQPLPGRSDSRWRGEGAGPGGQLQPSAPVYSSRRRSAAGGRPARGPWAHLPSRGPHLQGPCGKPPAFLGVNTERWAPCRAPDRGQNPGPCGRKAQKLRVPRVPVSGLWGGFNAMCEPDKKCGVQGQIGPPAHLPRNADLSAASRETPRPSCQRQPCARRDGPSPPSAAVQFCPPGGRGLLCPHRTLGQGLPAGGGLLLLLSLGSGLLPSPHAGQTGLG